MLRAVLAVIAGYAVIFVCVFASFSTAYLLMGTAGAFRPESYEVSLLWLAVSFPLALIAAVIGGFVCAKIPRGGRAPLVLAGLVFAFGLLSAVIEIQAAPAPAVRTAEVGVLEAMSQARQPTWVAWLNPFLGAAGILIGAKLATARVAKPRIEAASI
ncbi:MAG: hypothetical protein M3552_04625 [Planctomycetota bacterium]|nr:hypothetical protein [Planctomycetaceae bacterium]MDQ3329924.1 hypothetical protein [Planctomycetota bacterium]